jgi:hypothetical protein
MEVREWELVTLELFKRKRPMTAKNWHEVILRSTASGKAKK